MHCARSKTMFAAHFKFGPASGDSWTSYIEWSGLTHISEIVSTGEILCPTVIEQLIDEDWKHNIHEDYKVFFFRDFEYLKSRVGYDPTRHNLLAITERPTSDPCRLDGFEFCGYDILDSYDSVSVLTDCGGFPEIFNATEVNRFGLLGDLSRANEIAADIRAANPDDAHCFDCRVWSLSRYVGPA
jgi:hypothetical protein